MPLSFPNVEPRVFWRTEMTAIPNQHWWRGKSHNDKCFKICDEYCSWLSWIGWLSNRTGTSVVDGARKSNNWLDQWQRGKLRTGNRVFSFPRAFPSSNDVFVLLLNQPNILPESNRYVSVKSKLQHAPLRQPPGHLTFLKIIVQIPTYPGQNAVQMPHTRVHSGDQMPPPREHFTGT